GDSPEETIGRMARALGESRVEGVASNLEFLEHVIAHPAFATGAYTTKFVDETPELLESTPSPGGALGLLEFLGEVTVNGNPELLGHPRPAAPLPTAPVPRFDLDRPIPPGSRDRLRELGPERFLSWMRREQRILFTDPTIRDVQHFITQAKLAGIDLFRVFDSLNGVDNMRVAIDAVRGTGALCEAAMCYTGDLFDAARPKWNLRYYVDLARQLEKAGAQILGIKDMAGVCRPRAARALVEALRGEVGLPIHFDTHDASGIGAA